MVDRKIDIAALESWNNKRYQLQATNSQVDAVIIGENHENPEHRTAQLQIISLVQPGVILHEGMQGWEFNPATRRITRQENRRFGGLFNGLFKKPQPHWLRPDLFEISQQLKIKIVGCDLTDQESFKVFKEQIGNVPNKYKEYFDVEGLKIAILQQPPSWVWISMTDEVLPFRDHQIAKTVIDHLPSNPLAIVGAYHASMIHSKGLLLNQGFDYCMINLKQDHSS